MGGILDFVVRTTQKLQINFFWRRPLENMIIIIFYYFIIIFN